jgi:hypothetical protein
MNEGADLILLAELRNNRQCKIVQDMDRQRVWTVMRGLREFTPDEISVLTEIGLSAIRAYIFLLQRGLYIRQAGMRKDESGQRKAIFRLIKNTGPMAPEQRCCLVDHNIDVLARARSRGRKRGAKETKTNG